MPGLWAGLGLSLLSPGCGLGFSLVGLPVGPICGVWFDVGGHLCMGCYRFLLLGRGGGGGGGRFRCNTPKIP